MLTFNLKSIVLGFMFFIPGLMANKSPTPYNTWQIKSWFIVATEGFSPTWYPDGKGHSIACGYNDWGPKYRNQRRAKIAHYLKGGLTVSEAVEISVGELNSFKPRNPHSDKYVDLAARFYGYQAGFYPSYNQMNGCCGSKNGCAYSKAKTTEENNNVRKSHNRKLKFIKALRDHNWDVVNSMMVEFRSQKAEIERRFR